MLMTVHNHSHTHTHPHSHTYTYAWICSWLSKDFWLRYFRFLELLNHNKKDKIDKKRKETERKERKKRKRKDQENQARHDCFLFSRKSRTTSAFAPITHPVLDVQGTDHPSYFWDVRSMTSRWTFGILADSRYFRFEVYISVEHSIWITGVSLRDNA